MKNKYLLLGFLASVCLVILIVFLQTPIFTQGGNLDKSSLDFKNQSWIKYSLKKSPETHFAVDNSTKHSQNDSIRITNNTSDYSRYILPLTLAPNAEYKISCWVKTKDIGTNSTGACLGIEGMDIATKEGAYIKPLTNNGEKSFNYIMIYPSQTGPSHICSTDLTGNNTTWQNLYVHIKTGQSGGPVNLSFELGRPGKENTGTAWFNDLVIEKVSPKSLYAATVIMQISIFVLFIIILYVALHKAGRSNKNKASAKKLKDSESASEDTNKKAIVAAVFGLAVISRIVFSMVTDGHVLDIYCFKVWSSVSAESLSHMYSSGVFIDYPPFYLYILSIVGKVASIFNLYTVPWLYITLLKLPSIIAEILTGVIIYRIASSRFTFNMSIFVTSIYLFSAALFLDTCVWGQVDSFLTLLIVVALVLLYKEKYPLASVFFTIAVLTKPQGIIFLPILFFALVKSRKVMNFVYSFFSALATMILVTLPFALNEGALWIVKLYTTTLSQYAFAVLGAYNLFGLFNGTDKADSAILFIFSYKTWGFVFIVLMTCFTGYLYIKSKDKFIPFLSAFVLFTGVYMLSSRMHERYLLPVLAIALILFIYSRDKRILILYGCFSLALYQSIDAAFLQLISLPIQLMSFLNVALFAWLIKIAFDITIKGRISYIESDDPKS